MARGISIISILIIVCLCLMFGMKDMSYADSKKKDFMEQHIEEVKDTNPEEYQAMVERAGGKITKCGSCHINLKGKLIKAK